MDSWIRWTVALAVFAVVFGTSVAAVGLSTPPPSPEGSPAWFSVAPSQPGDRGLYKTALVVVSDGRGEYFDMNARHAFERVADGPMLTADGRLVAVRSFVSEWQTGPFPLDLRAVLGIEKMPALKFPDCWPQDGFDPMDPEDTRRWEDAMEACGEAWGEAGDAYGEEMEAWGEAMGARIEAWSEALARGVHQVEATGWHVTHHDAHQPSATNTTVAASYRDDTTFARPVAVRGPLLTGSVHTMDAHGRLVFTEPLALPGPCGWRSSLQEGPQDMWGPVTVHGGCPPDLELGFAQVRHEAGPVEVRVSGRDRVAGQPAVVFSTPADEDRLRLWFTESTPYPLRILTRTESVPEPVRAALGSQYKAPAFYVLHELIEFEAGAVAERVAEPSAPVLAGVRGAAGPALGAFEHPWPVEQALQDAADAAKAPESCRAWRQWAESRPGLVVQLAEHTRIETDDPDHADPIVDEAWLLAATDLVQQRAVRVQRHTETVVDVPAVPTRPPQAVRTSTYACVEAEVPPLPRPVMGAMPPVDAVADLLARWRGTEGTGYGFGDVCLATCAASEPWLTVGISPRQPGGGPVVDLLTVGPEGGLRVHMASGDVYPEPRFTDPAWDARSGRDPWRISVAGSGAFVMPQPATAATFAAAGAAAGAMVLLWPALKAALAAVPLFSRIRQEDLLEHPLRNQIHQLVTEEPGVHFQEMVRRVGKGRGTTEHHLRKLVAGGLLVEKTGGGFSCYFPKGRLDRQLMVAAPLLKSEGARQILQAIRQQPGSPALDISQRLGMATSTVNYHVKKLAAAGLVETQRDGRFVRLGLTGVGEQALGQYGGT